MEVVEGGIKNRSIPSLYVTHYCYPHTHTQLTFTTIDQPIFQSPRPFSLAYYIPEQLQRLLHILT